MMPWKWLFFLFIAMLPFSLLAQCDDDNPPSGSISASEVGCGGGQVTITFSLSDDDDDDFDVQYRIGGSTFNLSNIADGHTVTHTVTVSTTATLVSITQRDDDDDDVCTVTINQTINITVAAAPNLSLSTTNPGCGLSNGSISAQASGGTSPYQFSLNGGAFQSSSTFSSLVAGNYSVTVRDANGCQSSQNVSLTSGTAPTLTVSITNQPGCGLSNGSISAQASGGASPYQFSLNGGAFQSSGTFSSLAAGTYSVTVRDANGCESSQNVSLTSSANLTINLSAISQPTCAGKDGSLTIQTTGGIAPISYSIDGGAFQNSPTFSGLSPGTYTVTARDANGCQISTTAILNNPAAGLVNAQITTTNPTLCPGSNLTVSANLPQNTTGRWTTSSNAVQIGNANSRSTSVIASAPGAYTLTWTLSAPNCPNYSQAAVVLNVPALPQAEDDGVFEIEAASALEMDILENDLPNQAVRIRILKTPTLGTAQLLANEKIRYEAFAEESGRDTLVYQLCLDACPTLCDTALVIWQIGGDICDLENVDPRVIFPEGITPNGDGYNEALEFKIVDKLGCPTNYAQSDISIFNRWGDKVFHQEPYGNGWNGNTNDGKELPPGVYYYALRVRREGKKDYVRFGNVSIFR